jgi:hypothetical protein
MSLWNWPGSISAFFRDFSPNATVSRSGFDLLLQLL